MKEYINELKMLDNLLILIAESVDYCVSENKIRSSVYFNNKRLIFLEKEELIMRTNSPVNFQLTQKGLVFISNGGFVKERKKQNFNRNSNLINSISTPIIALISVTISIIALIRTNTPIHNENNLNNSKISEHIDSCTLIKSEKLNKTTENIP
jgi:hypothetical protein